MKKTLTALLAGAIILGRSAGCYKAPAELDFPSRYFSMTTPYVRHYDKENNISFHTMPHTEHYIDEAKGEIAELVKRTDKTLDKYLWYERRKRELKVAILCGKDYRQIMRKHFPNNPRRIVGLGVYIPKDDMIVLKSYYKKFPKPEQRVFVHEYIHFKDMEDGVEEIGEKETVERTNEVLGRPLSPFNIK